MSNLALLATRAYCIIKTMLSDLAAYFRKVKNLMTLVGFLSQITQSTTGALSIWVVMNLLIVSRQIDPYALMSLVARLCPFLARTFRLFLAFSALFR